MPSKFLSVPILIGSGSPTSQDIEASAPDFVNRLILRGLQINLQRDQSVTGNRHTQIDLISLRIEDRVIVNFSNLSVGAGFANLVDCPDADMEFSFAPGERFYLHIEYGSNNNGVNNAKCLLTGYISYLLQS